LSKALASNQITWQSLYAIWFAGHLLTFRYNFTEIIPGESYLRGS